MSNSLVSVKDFGALGNGTDDQPAISAAISHIFSHDQSTLYFPSGTYHLATPVVIDFERSNGLHLTGDAMAGFSTTRPGGARITGAAGMESMFIFKSNFAIGGSYSFRCTNIDFLGDSGPLTALKNKVGGGPARLFVVKNCNFVGFDKAIVSDITGTSGLTTGIAQVVIRENSFSANGKALFGTGGLGSIMNLVFCDNVAENGLGAILVDSPALYQVSENVTRMGIFKSVAT